MLLFAEALRLDADNAKSPVAAATPSLMLETRIRQTEVRNALHNLDVNKAGGPDGIPVIVLTTCAPECFLVPTRLFKLSLKTDQVQTRENQSILEIIRELPIMIV